MNKSVSISVDQCSTSSSDGVLSRSETLRYLKIRIRDPYIFASSENLWVSLGLNHRFALFSQCFRGSVGLSFRGSDFHRACGTKNRMKKTTSRGVDEPLPPSLSHRPSPRVSRGRCDGEGGRGGPLLSSPSGGLPDQTCAAITSISPTDSPEEPFF